jgi:protoporphyrinogen oxidase
VSTLPPERLLGLLPDATPELDAIRFTALISVVCATRQRLPDFYWMNLFSPATASCGIFQLSALNPDIGASGETCVNFVTHLRSRQEPLFGLDDDSLLARYRDDFLQVFGSDLQASWFNVARVPLYSPVLVKGYRNPPLQSQSFANLYFAGNYRTYPSIVSTGTALASGVHAAQAILRDSGEATAAAALSDLIG